MIPLPVSTHPVAAIQQRSAVQRRTQPRELEGENPNGFRSRTASKPGSKSGATGFRGGRVAHRPWGQVVLRPPPLPHIIWVAKSPLGRNRGGGKSTLASQPSQISPSLPPETLPYWRVGLSTW